MNDTQSGVATLCIQTSTKADGNMSFEWGEQTEVNKNRKKFLESQGLKLEDAVIMELEHGDRIVCVDTSHALKEERDTVTAEALITKEKGVALFLMTADCLPVVVFDSLQGVLALAHLGRKPTEKELLKKVIQRMQTTFSSEPEDMVVHISSGIHKESYILPFSTNNFSDEWRVFLEELTSGEVAIDLVGYNKVQLEEAGVLPENIHVSSIDTAVDENYFSHYRAVRSEGKEQEGRFATVAWLE